MSETLEPLSILSGNFESYYANGLTPEKIFGVGTDPFHGTWNLDTLEIPRRDDVLNQKFGGGSRAIEGYMRLLNDSCVMSSVDKFVSEITQRPINVTPASSSSRDEFIAEFVRQAIYRIGMTSRQSDHRAAIAYNSDGYNQITKGLAESYVLGLAGAGIVWVKQGKYILPNSIQSVDPRRIEITMNKNGDVTPRLSVWQEGYKGVEIPTRTFILHRFWSNVSYNDPWGSGVGRQLYPLVEFRRNLISMWLQYCDKNTTPNVIGKYPLGIGKEDHQRIFETLKTFGQQTIALFPEGVDVNYLTPGSSAPQVYQSLVQYLDGQISWLITGERDSAQSGQATGSISQSDRLSDSTRVKKAKAFNDSLESTINNTLVRWIVELNFGFDVTPPKISRNFTDIVDRTNKQALLGQLSMLKGLGYTVNDLDWVKEQLDIPSLTYDPAILQAASGLPTEDDADVAPSESPSEPQNVEGGTPAQEYSEKDNSFADEMDTNDGKVTAKAVSSILGLPIETLLEALNLTSENDLVDIDQLISDFLVEENKDKVEQIKQKFNDETPMGTPFYFELSKKLRSNEENPAKMSADDNTSLETANNYIAKSLRGTPQSIGFDALTSSTTAYEQSKLNLYTSKDTPVYEVLAAIKESIETLKMSQSRNIKPYIDEKIATRIDECDRLVYNYLHLYTKEDIRYKVFLLKEIVREIEYTIYNGFQESHLNYDLCLNQPTLTWKN